MKPISSQFPILKGLVASNQILAQPKGSVARISNLLFTKRGGLKTCDGSLIVNWFGGAVQTNRGMIEAICLFQPLNISRYFLCLMDALEDQLAVPSGVTASLVAGGSLLSGTTYNYVVTALDGAGGETTASSQVSATPSGGNLSVKLTWSAVTGAVAYNIYRSAGAGTLTLLTSANLPAFGLTYTDTGAAVPAAGVSQNLLSAPNGAVEVVTGSPDTVIRTYTTAGANPILPGMTVTTSGVSLSVGGSPGGPPFNETFQVQTVTGNSFGHGSKINASYGNVTGGGGTVTILAAPPVANTTKSMVLVKMPNVGNYPISYSGSNYLAWYPPAPVPIAGGEPAGTGGGGGFGGGGIIGGASPTPLGGVPGGVSTLPQIIQFNNQAVIVLGNGFAPQLFTDPATVQKITNTFIPAYPVWAASSPYALNSVITPSTTSSSYFVCVQPGTSGTTLPSFPTGLGQTVADGSIIWKNAGTVQSSAPAPPGAAHAAVYAGSLWVANTWPTAHPDTIDGPSALRMSDINAPNSWNPINSAFLDKDDGTEIQGLATFTITAQGIPPEGSLVVFKNFATYQIVGVFGSSNFAIQRVKSDMGCIAPRSIQFIPGFGLARLTHLGIAVFDGVEDKLISEEIRPYLFGSNDRDTADILPIDTNFNYGCYGFQTSNPPQYCLVAPIGSSNGQLTRVFCYDLVLKSWTVVDLPFALGSAATVRAQGTNPIAMFGGFSDGTLQRWQAGDIEWYTGDPTHMEVVDWSFKSNTMASKDADQRIYIRRLVLRGINTDSDQGITFNTTVNGGGVQVPLYSTPTLADGDFDLFIPVNVNGLRFETTVSGSGTVEIQALDFHVVQKAPGVPSVVA